MCISKNYPFFRLFLLEKSPFEQPSKTSVAINEASASSFEDAKQVRPALRPQPQPRQTNRTRNEAEASMVPINCKETTEKGWFYF